MSEIFGQCKENEPPFCAAACPFQLDVRAMMEMIGRGSFRAAYRLYRNAVAFPLIVSELCPEYCKEVCPRKDLDAAVEMRKIEQGIIANTKKLDPADYNVPRKVKSVAVIGGGGSGLSCALKLCLKKYNVTIFEKTERLGGRLRDMLPESILMEDIRVQFQYEELHVEYCAEIRTLQDKRLEPFDAIYLASGAVENTSGTKDLLRTQELMTTAEGVFAGGALRGNDAVRSIAQGIRAALEIEKYLLAGVPQILEPIKRCGLKKVDLSEVAPQQPLLPPASEHYNKEQTAREADRCLRCACDACKRKCDLIRFYRKSPLKIMEEVRGTTEVKGVLGEITVATKLIASCSQCGYCKELCPEGIDFQSYLLQARRTLHQKDAFPWAFHDFYLRDMEHARENSVFLQSGETQAKYLFFPGCQMGASSPEYVLKSYQWLLSSGESTAIMVDCCGVPAVWAGEEEREKRLLEEFRSTWEHLGRPQLIFGCTSCKKMMEERIAGLHGRMLYTLMDQWRSPVKQSLQEQSWSVFDPCSARQEPEVQAAVRSIAERAGARLQPLYTEKLRARCCGHGGHTAIVNPTYTEQVTRDRIHEGSSPYITYCSNCRDMFALHGKETIHILDIIFDLADPSHSAPTITQRRRNREHLKNKLLSLYTDKEQVHMKKNDEVNGKKLRIDANLKDKLSKDFLLEDEILQVIAFCEATDHKMVNEENGHCFGHRQIGHMTYWVEYAEYDGCFELISAYGHRMAIVEEVT